MRSMEARLATIRDVARHAGVTHTTVSHTLSGNRPVAAETRERVLAAVHELGYQPNAAARSLVSHRTRTVGLVAPLDAHTPQLSETLYAQFITSVADRLNAHDYRLLCFVARDPDAADVVRLVRSGQVDGMLLLQVRVDDQRVDALRREHLPFVTIGRPRHGAGLIRADADFAAGASLAVHHLADLGHRCIAFLALSPGGLPRLGFQYHSLAGFRCAHRDLKLPLIRRQMLSAEPDGGVRDALAPILRGQLRVTALVATTALEAVMAQHVLAEHGLRVPQDVSLVALNESILAQMAQPPITVVGFQPASLTAVAVDLLLEWLEGRVPARREYLVPVQLIARRSIRRVGDPLPVPAGDALRAPASAPQPDRDCCVTTSSPTAKKW